MVTNAELREQLRPQGLVSKGCSGCQFREQCGGYFSGKLFGNCFEELCCHFNGKDKAVCNSVCPYKADFRGWLRDTSGLGFDDLPVIEQSPLTLPPYVPVIHHRSSRRRFLDWPYVALSTYSVMGIRRTPARYCAKADTPEDLRKAYLLSPKTNVLLRGVAKDPQLERYWHHRLTDDAPGQIARLGIHAAIGPNFSHFLDVPRTDHLYNKRRQLLCLMELAVAGVTVVPHLNSVSPGDWVFWRRYLQANESVNVVALEFQTGHKNRREGQRVIDHLSKTQQTLGRPLHAILVGGGKFVEFAASRIAGVTLMDSTPFQKTMRRASLVATGLKAKWQEGYSLEGQSLDHLLVDNLTEYTALVERRLLAGRTGREAGRGA